MYAIIQSIVRSGLVRLFGSEFLIGGEMGSIRLVGKSPNGAGTMDVSGQYIKICDHPLIHDQWTGPPLDADYYHLHGGTYVQHHGNVHKLKASLFDEAIWLPRQDQIQGMIGDQDRCLDILLGLNEYHDFFAPFTGLPLVTPFIASCEIKRFRSMEKLWLAFYMHEKHSLKWEGEEWVKSK